MLYATNLALHEHSYHSITLKEGRKLGKCRTNIKLCWLMVFLLDVTRGVGNFIHKVQHIGGRGEAFHLASLISLLLSLHLIQYSNRIQPLVSK